MHQNKINLNMPPYSSQQSNSTSTGNSMLESLFRTKTDFLCRNGAFNVDETQCHQYETKFQGIENHCQEYEMKFQGGLLGEEHHHCHQFQGAVVPKNCSQQDVYNQQLVPGKHKRRSVSFLPHYSIRQIPSLSAYSRAEINALYMSRDEMADIHEECWRLVDLMNSGIEYEDHGCFSKRGLVDLKDDSVQRRRSIRDQVYQIVLGVQQFHAKNRTTPTSCIDVVEVTAGLYHKAASQARKDAYEAAWFDSIGCR